MKVTCSSIDRPSYSPNFLPAYWLTELQTGGILDAISHTNIYHWFFYQIPTSSAPLHPLQNIQRGCLLLKHPSMKKNNNDVSKQTITDVILITPALILSQWH